MTTTQNQVYQLANVGYDLYYIFNKFIVKNDDAFSDLKNILPNITYCSCLNMFIWNVCKSDRMLITHTVTSHKCDPSLCIQTALQALILCGTWADSLAAYYTEMVTGQYFSISPAAVVGWSLFQYITRCSCWLVNISVYHPLQLLVAMSRVFFCKNHNTWII